MKYRIYFFVMACLVGFGSYQMIRDPQPMHQIAGGVLGVFTFIFAIGVIVPQPKPDQNVYISAADIDSHEEVPQVFGEAGRWRPLYSPERSIGELTDEHLVNAVLWIDRKMTQAAMRDLAEWKWMQYLVGKSDELKAECLRRDLCVPVGKIPPLPDAYREKDTLRAGV